MYHWYGATEGCEATSVKRILRIHSKKDVFLFVLCSPPNRNGIGYTKLILFENTRIILIKMKKYKIVTMRNSCSPVFTEKLFLNCWVDNFFCPSFSCSPNGLKHFRVDFPSHETALLSDLH